MASDSNRSSRRHRWVRPVVFFSCLTGLIALGAWQVMDAPASDLMAIQDADWSDEQAEASSASTEAQREHYRGQWRYSEGAEGRERVRAAIEEATSDMNRVSRKLATRRLLQGLTPNDDDVITIALGEHTVDIELPLCPKLEDAPLEDTSEQRCAGEEFEVSHKLRGDVLLQRMISDEAKVYRRFVVDGDRLTLQVKLAHERLPELVIFELLYTRDPADALG